MDLHRAKILYNAQTVVNYLPIDFAVTRPVSNVSVDMLSNRTADLTLVIRFVDKIPCVAPCLLDESQLPLADYPHEIRDYAIYYDPLYFSLQHVSSFDTPQNLCSWLKKHWGLTLFCVHIFLMSSLLGLSHLVIGMSLFIFPLDVCHSCILSRLE